LVLHFVILCGRNKVGFVIDFKRAAAANPMQKPFVTLQGNLVTHLLQQISCSLDPTTNSKTMNSE
jgi:hypothetical protein